MSSNDLHEILEEHFGETIRDSGSVGGGCIANAQRIIFKSGLKIFVKSGFGNSMFQKEANGLKELARPKAIRIPQVLLVGKDFLILEFINSGSKLRNFFEVFGRQLAGMHRFTNAEYGFKEDNFIGSSQQANMPSSLGKTDWGTFYFENRLLFQYKMAEKKGHVDEDFRSDFKKLEAKLPKIIEKSDDPPTLMHGDLWGGNYMTDKSGLPVLIDPAVYYGHREADIAMTYVFGGFNATFYKAYQEAFPLEDGWEYRLNIYKLYHILNHLNIFGAGYYHEARSLIQFYLR